MICTNCDAKFEGDSEFVGGFINTKYGRSKIILFCCENCKNEYYTTKRCQICCAGYDFEIIDGLSMCKDDIENFEKPTCKEKYTENYKCCHCGKTKNILDQQCFIFRSEIPGKKIDTDHENIYVCKHCFAPHEKDFRKPLSPSGWIDVYNTNLKKYDDAYNYFKNCSSFLCNGCNEKSYMVDGCFIENNNNLCHKCHN